MACRCSSHPLQATWPRASRKPVLPPRRWLRALRFRRTFSAIIEGYVAQLGNESRMLLSAAAVCGAEFRIDTLARSARARGSVGRGRVRTVAARAALARAPRAKDQEVRARSHIPSGTPCSDKSSTIGWRRPLAPNFTARWALCSSSGGPRSSAVAAAELAMHFDRGRTPMAALRYYSEAAQTALLHLSPAECMSLD